MSIAYSTDGTFKVITVTGSYSGSLADALSNMTGGAFNPASDNLRIIGSDANQTAIWTDFQFLYSTAGQEKPSNMHIENITFQTTNVNGYCIYTRDTLLTMKNVTINGYSGGQGRWTETGGGALRLRTADYSSLNHTASTPTLDNVTVTNCCRGLRIQDTNGCYAINCKIEQASGADYAVSDNGLYFAANDYKSGTGCQNCTFDTCTVEKVGQVAFMSIGGFNNEFKNCTMNTSTGAGFGCYNTNGTIKATNCTFTNANTAVTGETSGWGGGVDNFEGAACGMNVETTDTSADVIVSNCTFVSGGNIVYSKTGAGALTPTNNTVTLSAFTGGLGKWLSYTTDGNYKVITVYGTYSGTLADALTLTGGTFTTSSDNDLKITGSTSTQSDTIWNDFQFGYSTHGKPEYVHIENITFYTTSVDGYCLYTRDTLLTMKNVTIDGYSGGEGRWTETGGGALRLRAADYSSLSHTGSASDGSDSTLFQVTVTNCCRGLRLQDSTGIYVKGCDIVKGSNSDGSDAAYGVSDNGLYFAAGDYKSSTGCQNCTFDDCEVEGAGQVAFMSIGGANNKFINCKMNTSTGAGFGCYNTNGIIKVTNCEFTNANTAVTGETAGHGGGVDNFGGAACGMNVETGDTSAEVIVSNCTFNSGSGDVFWKSTTVGTMKTRYNTLVASGFPNGGWGTNFTPPVITQVTPISNDASLTPSYVFSSDVAGTITSSLAFSTTTTSVVGNNTVTFNTLTQMSYSGETITITNAATSGIETASLIIIPDFTVDVILTSVSIATSNAASSLTKANDTITLSFTSSHAIATPTVAFTSGSSAITGAPSITNTSGNDWTATYLVNSGDTEGLIGFAVDFTNTEGNSGTQVTSVTDATSVTVDLVSPDIYTLVSIESNNTVTTTAKTGDVVTLTFTATETIKSPTVTFTTGGSAITGTAPTITNTSGNTWTAVYTIMVTDTDGAVGFTIDYTDTVGNAGTQINNVTDGTSVTVEKELPDITTFIMDDSALKLGNPSSVSLVFSSTVEGFVSSSYIAPATSGSGTLSLMTSNSDNTVWTGIFTPSNAINDANGVLTLSMGKFDGSGNEITNSVTSAGYESGATQTALASVTPITFNGTTTVINRTPSFVFSSTQAGTITVNNATFSSSVSATSGNNTITFDQLADYTTHDTITIIVTDSSGKPSAALTVPSFTVDTTTSTIDVINTVSGKAELTNTLTSNGVTDQTGKTTELPTNTNQHASYKARITYPNADYSTLTEANKNNIKMKVAELYSTELKIDSSNTIYVDIIEGSVIIDVYVMTTAAITSNILICFPKGTPVVTNQGEIPIEDIIPGVHTIRGKNITAITCTHPNTEHIVLIKKNALGKNIPSIPTRISNHHRVFYKGKMVKASDLVNMCEGVIKSPYNGESLYNVVMKKHDKMMVNNLICETLHPNNVMARICAGEYTHREKVELCNILKRIGKTNDYNAYNKFYATLK